jgi:dolichol kinase
VSEVGRRLVHVSGTGLPGLFLLDVVSWSQVQYVLLAATVVALVLEALRLRGDLDLWVYRRFTREYEQERVAGYALAILGATLTVWVFGPDVAVPALLMLTLADPISGVLSRGVLGVKQVYVLLAMFGSCLAIASLLLVPFWPAVAGSVAATAADGIKPTVAGRVIDDNLTIPVVAATAMALVLSV